MFSGEESVKELQRKRHTANPDVSFKGRVRKIAKWNVTSDSENDLESLSESILLIMMIIEVDDK